MTEYHGHCRDRAPSLSDPARLPRASNDDEQVQYHGDRRDRAPPLSVPARVTRAFNDDEQVAYHGHCRDRAPPLSESQNHRDVVRPTQQGASACRINTVAESPFRKRRRQRLSNYDYSQPGAYFVTICTHGRACLFGHVCDSTVSLNGTGQIVYQTWAEMGEHYAGIGVDEFVVMPNHLHGVLFISDIDRPIGQPPEGRAQGAAATSLPDIMRRFKTLSTNRIRKGTRDSSSSSPPHLIWQRSYYEHVIRNDESLNRIREYIVSNPVQWSLDRENPEVVSAPIRVTGRTGSEQWMV